MTISPDVRKLQKLTANAPKETVKEYEDRFVMAINHGQTDDVRALLALGVNPNCCAGEDKVLPLHIIAASGDMKLFNILFNTGKLNLNSLSLRGTPAIIIAIFHMRDEFVKVLTQRGANVNVSDRFGRTPLHHSVYSEYITMVKILLDCGSERNPVDIFCSTPLSLAAIDVASLPMVKLLVEHGASVNFDRGEEVKPLILELALQCTDSNRLAIADYLLQAGAEPNAIDPRTGRNALHMTALNNNLEMAKLLLKYGTDPSVVDSCRLCPFEIAYKHKNDEVGALLEDALEEGQNSGWALNKRRNEILLPTLIDYYQAK